MGQEIQERVAQGKMEKNQRLSSVCTGQEQTDFRLVGPEVKNMTNENAQLVPLVKLGGKEYLVDIDNRQFIEIEDLNQCIDMHSMQGRDMVKEMLDTEWRCFSVYPRDDGMEV